MKANRAAGHVSNWPCLQHASVHQPPSCEARVCMLPSLIASTDYFGWTNCANLSLAFTSLTTQRHVHAQQGRGVGSGENIPVTSTPPMYACILDHRALLVIRLATWVNTSPRCGTSSASSLTRVCGMPYKFVGYEPNTTNPDVSQDTQGCPCYPSTSQVNCSKLQAVMYLGGQPFLGRFMRCGALTHTHWMSLHHTDGQWVTRLSLQHNTT